MCSDTPNKWQTLPLMNVVFGNLVGDFNAYFIPDSGVTESQFNSAVSKNRHAKSSV
jgi:hypothetical protein